MTLPIENIRYRPIGDSFKEMGHEIRTNIPRVVIGNKSVPASNPPPQTPPPNYAYPPQPPIFNPQEAQWINKFKKWGLIIAVSALLIYAAWRIIVTF